MLEPQYRQPPYTDDERKAMLKAMDLPTIQTMRRDLALMVEIRRLEREIVRLTAERDALLQRLS